MKLEANTVSSLARIGIYARSEMRFFMVALARALKSQWGSSIVLYVGNAEEGAFYAQQGAGAFDEIVQAKTLHATALESAREESVEVARARVYEKKLGKTYNFLAVSNRHLGRGYAPGGLYHPRSRVSSAGYVGLLHAYNEVLDFWSREIRERQLTLLINGPHESAPVAEMLNVPYRIIIGSRYRNYHYWAWNEYLESPLFEDAYRGGNRAVASASLEAPYVSHMQYRAVIAQYYRSLTMIKQMALQVARYVYWKARGYEKAKGYYLSDNLAYFYRLWAAGRKLRTIATTRVADLAGHPYVFYPLQVEPEVALQGISPEYVSQLSIIVAISRELPAGYRLAVKEHVTAVGRRPADFYRQISELKNVVLIEPFEFGLDLVREAAVTVTICGTSGFEAAIMGKPVVAVGRHNIYNFLPHVRVTDEFHLGPALREAIASGEPNERTRADGARFLDAVIAHSFDMRDYSYQKLAEFSADAVEDAAKSLAAGLSILNSEKLYAAK